MNEQFPQFYEFGEFRLDASKRLLRRNGETVRLMPKAFDVLLTLVQNCGQVVTKDDLMTCVWHDTVVEENSLNVNVSGLRKIFGEKPNDHRFIVTVPGIGYKFVADVREVCDELKERGTTHKTGNTAQNPVVRDSVGKIKNNGDTMTVHSATSETKAIENRKTVNADFIQAGKSRDRRVFLAASLAVFFSLLIAGVFLYKFASFGGNPTINFQGLRATKLTTTGNVVFSAISPDGKYVAFATREGETKELWVRQTAIASSVRLVSASAVSLVGITFSKDGNFVYYVIYPKSKDTGTLYRVPVLGGDSQKVSDNVGTPISFSPDGKQFVFVVANQAEKRDELTIADADGTNQKVLATRQFPGYGWFPFSNPAWSPDGKKIACLAASEENNRSTTGVIEINVADGAERSLTAHQWEYAMQLAWLADGSGLLITARNHDDYAFQIWHLSYSDGAARRVTGDVSNYWDVSLTANSDVLATVQRNQLMSIWLSPIEQPDNATRITPAGVFLKISWTPDGKLVYQYYGGGGANLWIMEADGTKQKQLTSESGQDNAPAVSPDGRYIVFHSNRSGIEQIWRIDIDGGNPKHLVGGDGESLLPEFSPDGKWVFYTDGSARNIFKVPIDGGEPIRLTDKTSIWATISPDGKLFACWWLEPTKDSTEPRIALISTEGGNPIKTFNAPPGVSIPFYVFPPAIRWTADGEALLYIGNRNGVSNIFRQPVKGGEPTQITNFTSEQIYHIALSRDGKQIAFSRGFETNDVMLLSDVR